MVGKRFAYFMWVLTKIIISKSNIDLVKRIRNSIFHFTKANMFSEKPLTYVRAIPTRPRIFPKIIDIFSLLIFLLIPVSSHRRSFGGSVVPNDIIHLLSLYIYFLSLSILYLRETFYKVQSITFENNELII